MICRPRSGIDVRREIGGRAGEEMAALRELRDEGLLLEAYSPGGPGAVLILAGEREHARAALGRLPLVRDGIVDAELLELHPFAALADP